MSRAGVTCPGHRFVPLLGALFVVLLFFAGYFRAVLNSLHPSAGLWLVAISLLLFARSQAIGRSSRDDAAATVPPHRAS